MCVAVGAAMSLRSALLLLPVLATFASGCAVATDDAAASSDSALAAAPPHLLALGDSMTFAWNPHVESDVHKVEATKYSGYAEALGQHLGLTVDNAACPGETSGAMLDAHEEDNGCRDNRAAYALHYPWSAPTGTTPATQIDFAKAYLDKALAAGRPPELVTMTMGGNDLLLVQKHCKLPLFLEPACELVKLPFYVHAYGDHMDAIATAIDATGYSGKFVVLTTYAPDYSDRVATLGLEQLNGELVEHVGKVQARLHHTKVVVADGYGAFKAIAAAHGGKTCETGLLIKNDDGTCDIHPTAAGHQVLAGAVLQAIGR